MCFYFHIMKHIKYELIKTYIPNTSLPWLRRIAILHFRCFTIAHSQKVSAFHHLQSTVPAIIMPPVRTGENKQSNKSRSNQYLSPSRGRGIRRRPRSVHGEVTELSARPTGPAVVNAALGESPKDSGVPNDVGNTPGEFDSTSDHQSCIMPPVDTRPPATDFTGPNFAVSDFQPTMVDSVFDPVSAHVPLKLKNQIWEGKFVDLSLLLRSAREIDGHLESEGQIEFRNGVMCLVKSKNSSYLTIDKWTSAFLIFMSVVLEKYRTRGLELLKYLRDIRMAASRSQGWVRYDEQFRLRKQANPQSSWGVINSELWLLYMLRAVFNLWANHLRLRPRVLTRYLKPRITM